MPIVKHNLVMFFSMTSWMFYQSPAHLFSTFFLSPEALSKCHQLSSLWQCLVPLHFSLLDGGYSYGCYAQLLDYLVS